MIIKGTALQANHKIPLDDLKYSSTDGKYSFQFSHLEKGIFLLTSKGYADDNSIKAQLLAGDETRLRLNKYFPGTDFHLIWDMSEVRGASIFARYNIMLKAATSGTFVSISIIGANNLAKSFIRIISSSTPHLKFYFYKFLDEAIDNVQKRLISESQNENVNFYSSSETDTYAHFIDLWQANPKYLEINQRKFKTLQLEHWKYSSDENSFNVAFSVLESNIIIIKCKGTLRTINVKNIYHILEDVMARFGYVNSQNKFYTIVDLQKVKGITLNARKLTNYYEELYKSRSHMVTMVPSPIIHFALKIQKKINLSSFNHWVECNDLIDAFTLIQKHKDGQFSPDETTNSNNIEKLEIPEKKEELVSLVKKLHDKNQQLKKIQYEHIQRILEITGRMTWDESFSSKLKYIPESYAPFIDVYNALSLVHEDFKEIIKEKELHTQKLRESEDKYWNLINLASDIIAVYQDNTCKLVNSRVKDFTGYSPEEIINKSNKELIHPEEYLQIKKIIDNVLENTPSYFETHLIHKNGQLVAVSVSVGFIIFENKPAKIFIIRDITAKRIAETELDRYRNQLEAMVVERTRQLEKEIHERESAEKSDRLKSAFLSNMSHEIRTPMNAIIAFSNFLRNPDLSNKQKEEYINYIQSSGQSLLNLINDIIDISKIEAKQINIHKVNCTVNPILDELYTLFDQTRKTKNCIDLELNLIKKHENNNLIINTDQYRLKQILSNLLHNALKFTEKGFIEFGYEIKNKSIEFFVKDTGIGIPEEKIELIFQRFGKLETSGKNKGGTGLGLAISQNLALLLDGKLTVETSQHKGSTFYLTLPYHGEQEVLFQNPKYGYVEKQHYHWENKRILVAEDEELNFMVIQIALKDTKALVIRAADGNEAVKAIVNDEKYDMILMDIQMPVMDGYTALNHIKLINSKIPIIAQTAFALIEEKEKCLDAGFTDYISKPINISELLMKIDKYISL